MKTKFLKIFIFIFIFSFMFYWIPRIFDKHRDARNWEYIYNTDYNIDILFMGSSLIFTSLNPYVIDPIIKYDSFNLGSSGQNIIQAYYNLVEVLKYRKIELIILDVNTIITEDVKVGYIYNNLSGMHFSENKINSFLNSINRNSISDVIDASKFSMFEEWGSIASLLIKEKFNWKNDIKSFSEILNEYGSIIDTRGFFKREKYILLDDYNKAKDKKSVSRNISLKNQKFFEDFINLCNENTIDLILLQIPVLEKRTIKEIDFYTDKYNTPYYNFSFKNDKDYYNYKYEDFSDEVHFSANGSEKFSIVFADSLNKFLNYKKYK
tara:strand:- start:205 stop:1170 length:966 start_codon:yes stop_codon:yes gene_type:complete